GRELNDRMAEQQALMESQQKEMQKVAKAREELEAREHRFETAKAELEARAKALEQREKRLKQLADSLEGERAESKTMMKKLEAEGERVSQKEATIEALVARNVSKEREAIEEQTRKVRAMAADLKGKDKTVERGRARLQALQRELEARQASLEKATMRIGERKSSPKGAAEEPAGSGSKSRDHTDRRQEGHRLHAEQHPGPEPAPEDPDEHVSGNDEERDAGHGSHHVSAIGHAPLEGLQDREGRQRHEDGPPSAEQGTREQARDEDRLDVRVRPHDVRAEDREEDQEDAEDPGAIVSQARVNGGPPSARHHPS